MKLVIDIFEGDYAETMYRKQYSPREMDWIDRVIAKGIPLPKCKNCKYFEYDSVAKVDGIPLIVAHEICNKWGDGCKTKEDGYCFLFEPQESEDKE